MQVTVCLQGPKGKGSLLEQTWGGKQPITLDDGQKRVFLKDGDTVTLHALCQTGNVSLGFGSCTGRVLEAFP